MACLHPITKRGKTVYRLVLRKEGKIFFTKTFPSFDAGEQYLRDHPEYGTLRSWNPHITLGIRPRQGNKGEKIFSFKIEHKSKKKFSCCFVDFDEACRFRDLVWEKYKKDPSYLHKDIVIDCVYFKLNGCLLDKKNSSENDTLKMQIEILLDRIKELENDN